MAKLMVVSNYRSAAKVNPEAEIFISLREKKGHDIFILTFEDAEYTPRFEEHGITILPFHPVSKTGSHETRILRNYIKEIQPDVLFLFNSKAILHGIRASRGLPHKLILYRGYSANIHWWDPFAYMKFLHPRVDKIICNSSGVEEHIQRNLWYDKSRTITIHKGHDLSWYEKVKAKSRQDLPVPHDAFVFSCVANDRRMKGIKYLMEAMTHLPTDTSIHLLLIGKGLDAPKYKRIIQNHSIASHIHFLGFQPDALSYVAASNAFVLSSIKGESITKAVLEAMSLGVPPLITDIAGNRELVVAGESGLVVPYKNSKALASGMQQMADDTDTSQMGQNAKKRIATVLSHHKTVEGYHQVVEHLKAEAKLD